MIGKPGAGLCPVRGHSNVQGDRTMGIWEKMPETFLAALDARVRHHQSARARHRHRRRDPGDARRPARRCSSAWAATSSSATPDTDVTEAALRSCALTVQVSTKLNRSHVVHGRTALILPTLGRTDTDIQAGGKQLVSVEDSMSMVHLSRGSLHTAERRTCAARSRSSASSRAPCSAPTIRCRGSEFTADYDPIRDAIAAVVPGCADYNTKVRQPDGFQLPHPPRDSREFPTTHRESQLRGRTRCSGCRCRTGRLVLQTLRSHDQYNTTIYGLDDRYRGVKGGRRVVFVNPADIEAFGLSDGDRVDLVSEFTDGDGQLQERRAKDFMVVPYSTPVGNAAAYYPETNPLVPLDHMAAQVEYAGVQGDRRSDWKKHGPGDRARGAPATSPPTTR